jgi:uncharacterized membrane protein YkvA (DUF1232 family)
MMEGSTIRPEEPRGFASARKHAESIVGDAAKVANLVTRASRKAEGHWGPLARTRDDLMTLLRLLKAWMTRAYREVGATTMVVVIAAVIYFVNPFDVVPDFLPIVGYLDDATVVGFVIATLKREIEKFRTWEQQARPVPGTPASTPGT